MGTSQYSPCILVSNNVNISNSVFSNISSNYSSPLAGAICYYMTDTANGHYNITNNTFFDISTNKSVLVLDGYFLSFSFGYNSFYNVGSVNQGRVY
jgi:hypothetical protein